MKKAGNSRGEIQISEIQFSAAVVGVPISP